MNALEALELRLKSSTALAVGLAVFALLADTTSVYYLYSNNLRVPAAQLTPGLIYLGLALLTSNFIFAVSVFFLIVILTRVRLREVRWRLAFEKLKEGAHPVDAAIRNHVVTIENLNIVFAEFMNGLQWATDPHTSDRTAHLGLFVNRVKTIFDRLSTSGQCAVCIKVLGYGYSNAEPEGPYVWTAIRDDASAISRGKVDYLPRLKRYRPDENKAFSAIMSSNSSKEYFFSNDLEAMGKEYFNSAPHWDDYYNAVVVVPIKPCREEVAKSTAGFLCVDSRRGKFNEDTAVGTLVLAAEILYAHIQNFSEALAPSDRR